MQSISMKQYEMFELSFDGPVLNDNWADVNISAFFTDGDATKTVNGFYAGGGKYKIRYLPENSGTVSWKVSGIAECEGSAFCAPASEGSHGIVRAEGTALKHSDGSWFFSFGTTVYGLAHQNEDITEQTFETLEKSPFNKVRMCVFPKHYDYNVNDPEYFPFEVREGQSYRYERGMTFNSEEFLLQKREYWDVNRPCINFWDSLEEKIIRLGKMGIQVDLILFHPYDRWGFSCLSQEENLIYLSYALKRLSAFPNIWWSLANEYDLCFYKSIDNWHEIEEYVASNDPFSHLLSNHNCFPAYDFSRPNITHCSLQKRIVSLVPQYMERYGKPVLYDECVYEGNLKQSWGSISGEEMMNRFWKVTTHGGYCTHGEVYLDDSLENTDNAVLWWAKGGKLTGSSPDRIAFLRTIIEEIGAPLTPYESGFSALMSLGLKNEYVRSNLPDSIRNLINLRLGMDPVERALQEEPEVVFAGHTSDNSHILIYNGTDRFGRIDISLPDTDKGACYKVEIIDAWNMTRSLYSSSESGDIEVKLPGREYIAVLCTKNK